jgi:gluconokinase
VKTSNRSTQIIVLTGVSGSGKTTLGRKLAEKLDWDFYDADDFHLHTNLEKMARGIPLTDEDRWPWLDRLRHLILELIEKDHQAVVACSALKTSYRERLLRDTRHTQLVYLRGDYELIKRRMEARQDHFFEAGMLKSQFEILEEPRESIIVNIDAQPDVIVEEIIKRLDLSDL